MTDLIDTTEMYLRTILELEEEGIVPLRARIAERLHHSGPTVSQTIARMERDGLVVVSGDRHLEFTDEGRELSIAVMRKHRLAERLLADVIGLEWAYVHEEACRWEHVMSEQVEKKLYYLLERPEYSPYGNPIPGLEVFGGKAAESFTDGVVCLSEKMDSLRAGEVLVVKRLAEPIQVDPELLQKLKDKGISPGAKIRVEKGVNSFAVHAEGMLDALVLSRELADYIFVS